MRADDGDVTGLRARVVEGDVLLDSEARAVDVAVGRGPDVLARVRPGDCVLDHTEELARHGGSKVVLCVFLLLIWGKQSDTKEWRERKLIKLGV